MIVKIDIVNKRPSVVGTPVIVCGNSGYTIEFTFDGEWASAAVKTARFVYVKGGAVKYQDVAFSGTVVEVPILSEIREVYVGVYAGDLRTTTPARIPCERSILCGTGTEHEEPDPDVYNQILEVVNQLIGEVGNHPARTDNPHGVTAEQVGARPNTWTPTAQEVGARPDTWMPSASDVGAAPAGYGVGEYAVSQAPLANADTATLSGRYRIDSNTENGVVASALLIVDGYSNNYVKHTAIRAADGYIQERSCINGLWGEWCWRTYAGTIGVEYRTTERWQGKAVYTAVVDLGKFVSGGITATTNLTATAIIRYCGVCNRFSIPAVWSNDLTNTYSITASVFINDLTSKQIKVHVGGGSNNVNNIVYMQIWYTKE